MRVAACFVVASFLSNSACGGGGDPPTEPTPQVTIPSARSGHAMVYDDARRVVLLFGGNGATALGDLWSWNGTRWSRLATSGPPARDDAVLAFDSRRQRLVLFGGRSGQTLLSDTWEWDGTSWSQKTVTGPDARLHAVSAFDAQRGVVRMYGGVGSDDVPRTDTWEWDGAAWTRVSTTGPNDHGSNFMAYDAGRQRMVLMLFDRIQRNPDGTRNTDVWEWSGTTWTAVPGTPPSISPIQPMVGLGTGGGILLFDGGVVQGTASTWILQNAQWTRASTSGPPLRNGHAMAYDSARNRVVLFGGFRPGQDFNDTWEWNGTQWAQITPN